MTTTHLARTPVLDIGYEAAGDPDGPAVVLLHGFPYDVRAFDGVVPVLAGSGARVIVPYLRGFGPTRFRSAETPRSGQQAAIGRDLIELLDALSIERAIVAGYDWGGRAACIAAALYPERVLGLVTAGGYNIQDVAGASAAHASDFEPSYWYQYYLHSDRGREGLEEFRNEFCELLWRLWSPTWAGASAAFAASAPSLANADFVEIVVHSYRHRYGLAEGDPGFDDIEAALAKRPVITVPTITLDAGADGVAGPEDSREDSALFSGRYERHLLPGTGHNIPQENPEAFAAAVLRLL